MNNIKIGFMQLNSVSMKQSCALFLRWHIACS